MDSKSRAAAILALVLAVLSLLGTVFPFVGFLGLCAIALAKRARPRSLSLPAMVMGGLAAIGAIGWVLIFWVPAKPFAHGACPHVYSYDGADYRLDADMVSASLYSWGERRDVDRLEYVKPEGGEYRLRIVNDREETDYIDSLAISIVDHPQSVEVLPTTKGDLVAVEHAQLPLRVVDGAGADVHSALDAEDGAMLKGAVTKDSGEPRQRWTLDFTRPQSERALLIIRAHTSSFAEEAFSRYLATLGQGMGPLMEHIVWPKRECACTQEVLDEEMARLGMPLVVSTLSNARGSPVFAIPPIGPGVVRSFALPVQVEAQGNRVSFELQATPLFWDIDQVQLAPMQEDPPNELVLAPRTAVLVAGPRKEDVLDRIVRTDHRRLTLPTGQHVDVRFDVPLLKKGSTRSVFVALRGYYQLSIGGKRLVNLAAVLAHRFGLTSLPRFAAELAPYGEPGAR